MVTKNVGTPYAAEYKCTRCQHRFDVMQGPGAQPSSKVCQKCGHKWVEWLNYQTLYRDRFSKTVP